MCAMREFSLGDSEGAGLTECEGRLYRMIDSYEGEDGV